jgi:hypothetical protein
MARNPRKELSSKECKHCTKAFLGRSNKQYCSDQCATAARVNKHRKNKTASGIRKYVKKADKFEQTSFALYLYREIKRAGTVQILQGHTADSLHELSRLKRQCSRHSGYISGKPTGTYHQSHIWTVKPLNGRIGLLHPENLVIAPRPFNLAHGAKQPTRQGVGRFIATFDLLEIHKLSDHDTAAQVFQKVKRLLGQEWVAFIATFTIQQTQAQLLRAQLKKRDIAAPADMSLGELRQSATTHEIPYFSADFSAHSPVGVALSELVRFGHDVGEFSIYHRWLALLWEADMSLDCVDLPNRGLVEVCLLNETWAILHGVAPPKRTQQEQAAMVLFALPRVLKERKPIPWEDMEEYVL